MPITYSNKDLNVIIEYHDISQMTIELKEWAFNLVKSNLYHLYRKSNDGWNALEKKAEMSTPEARYLIARSASDPNILYGFLLFQMVTEETMDDDVMAEVAYCYELQLVESARNYGLGEYFMKLLAEIGNHWKMDKMMLTVFKSNKGAFRFYKKLGFELDEISPSACLSALQARKFDYEILSKKCS
ncbi:hypothetical protein F4703DRAFT_1826134 [Phycomyces blakesleeanus]